MADDKDKIISDLLAQLKRQNDLMSKITTGIDTSGSTTKSVDLSDLSGSFDKFFEKLPGGEFIRQTYEAGKSLYNGLKAINDRALIEANSIFEMYRTGVAISSDEMINAADSFNVDFGKFTDLMVKHSMLVANVGIPTLTQFGKQLSTVSRFGAIYAMNQDQLNESMMNYTEIVNLSGDVQNRSTQELVAGFDDFTRSVLHASQVTGRSTDVITENIKTQLRDYNTQYVLNSMNKDQQTQLSGVIAAFQDLNTETNNIGDIFAKNAVLFKQGGNSFGYVEPAMRNLIANTSTASQFMAIVGETDPTKMPKLIEDFENAILNSDFAKAGVFTGPEASLVGQLRELSQTTSKPTTETKPLDKFATDLIDLNEQINASMAAVTNSITKSASSIMAVSMPKLQQFAESITNMKDDAVIPAANEIWRLSTTAKSVSDAFVQIYNDLNDKIGGLFPALPDVITTPQSEPTETPTIPPPQSEPSPTEEPAATIPARPISYENPVEQLQKMSVPAVFTAPTATPLTTTPYIVDIKYEPPQPLTATIPDFDTFVSNFNRTSNTNNDRNQTTQESMFNISEAVQDSISQKNNELIPYVTKMVTHLSKLLDKIDHQTVTLKNSINSNNGIVT